MSMSAASLFALLSNNQHNYVDYCLISIKKLGYLRCLHMAAIQNFEMRPKLVMCFISQGGRSSTAEWWHTMLRSGQQLGYQARWLAILICENGVRHIDH